MFSCIYIYIYIYTYIYIYVLEFSTGLRAVSILGQPSDLFLGCQWCVLTVCTGLDTCEKHSVNVLHSISAHSTSHLLLFLNFVC